MRLRGQWKTRISLAGSERFPGGGAVPWAMATLGGLARRATEGLPRSVLALAVSLTLLAYGGGVFAQTTTSVTLNVRSPTTLTEGGGIVDVVLTASVDAAVSSDLVVTLDAITSDDVTIEGSPPSLTIRNGQTTSGRSVLQLIVTDGDTDTGNETVQFTATTDDSGYTVTPLSLTIGDSALTANRTRLAQKQLRVGEDSGTFGWEVTGIFSGEYMSTRTLPAALGVGNQLNYITRNAINMTIGVTGQLPGTLLSNLLARLDVGGTVTDLNFGDATETESARGYDYQWTSGLPALPVTTWITLTIIQVPSMVTLTAVPTTITEGGGIVDVILTASVASSVGGTALNVMNLATVSSDVTVVGTAPTLTIPVNGTTSPRVILQLMVVEDADSGNETVQFTATTDDSGYTVTPLDLTIGDSALAADRTRLVQKQVQLVLDGGTTYAWDNYGTYNAPAAISSITLPTGLREGAGGNEIIAVSRRSPEDAFGERAAVELRHQLPDSVAYGLLIRFVVGDGAPMELRFGDAEGLALSGGFGAPSRYEYSWTSGAPVLPAGTWITVSLIEIAPEAVTLAAVPTTITEGGGIVDVVLTAGVDAAVSSDLVITLDAITSDDVTIAGTPPSLTIASGATTSGRAALQLVVPEDADSGNETVQFTGTTDNFGYAVTPLDITIGDSTLAANQTRLLQRQLRLDDAADGTNGWDGTGTTYPDEYLSSTLLPPEVHHGSGDGNFNGVFVKADRTHAIISLDQRVLADLRSLLLVRFDVGGTVTDLSFREGVAAETNVGQGGVYTWSSGVPATTADSWITLSLIQNEPTPVTITANSSTPMNPVTVTEGGGTVELRLNASVPAGSAPDSALTITLAGTSTGTADSDDFTIVGYFTSQGDEDSAITSGPPALTIASGETDADEVYMRMTVPLGADMEPEQTITLAATLSGTNSSAFTSDGLDITIATTQPAAGETRIAEKQVNMATDTGTAFGWNFQGSLSGELSSTDFAIGNQSFRYSIISGDIVSSEVTRISISVANKGLDSAGDHSLPEEGNKRFRFTTSRGTHDLRVDDATEDSAGSYVWRATQGTIVQDALAALTIMPDEWFTLTLVEGPPLPEPVVLGDGSTIKVRPEAAEVSEAAMGARVRVAVAVLGTLPAAVGWKCRLNLPAGTVEATDFASVDDIDLALQATANDSSTCTWDLTNDTIVESTEMAVVQVVDPGPTAAADDDVLIDSATINVTSDDAATVSVASADSAITEDPVEDSGDPDMDVTVTITRSAPATTAIEALPVRWTLSGDVVANDFFSTDSELGDALAARQLSGTITIPAGSFGSGGTITRTVTFQVRNDDDDEADSESFTLTLSSPTGWPSVTAPSATVAGTIADNETNQDTNPRTVSVITANATAVESDSGAGVTGSAGTVTVEVSRDAPTGGVTFPLILTLGDDIEDGDWEVRDSGGTMLATTGTGATRTMTATVAEDTRRFTFTVHALDDNVWEHAAISTAETITVSVPATGTDTGQLGAGLQQDADAADQSATITLVDSDSPPQIVLALGTATGAFDEDDAANFMNTITASIPAMGSSVFPTRAELWLALVPVESSGAVFLDPDTADANSDIYFTPGRDQEAGDDGRWDIAIPTGVTGALTDVVWTFRVTDDVDIEADESFAVRAEVIGEPAAAAGEVADTNALTLGTLVNTDVVDIGFSESEYTITEGNALNTTDGVVVTYSTPMTAAQVGDDEAWITVSIELLGGTTTADFRLVGLGDTGSGQIFTSGVDIGNNPTYYFFTSAGVTSEAFPLQFVNDGEDETGEQVRLRFWFSEFSVDQSHPAYAADGESDYVDDSFGVGAHHTTTITIMDAAPGEYITFTTTAVLHQAAICLDVSWTNPSGADFPYHSLVRSRIDGTGVVTLAEATLDTGDMLGVPYTSPTARDCPPADQEYRYTVRRFPETAGGGPANVAHADRFLPRAPLAVTNIQYEPPTAVNPMGRLTWGELAAGLASGYSTIDGYEIQYLIDADLIWRDVKPAHTGTERSYSDSIIWKQGTSVRFRVRATNAATRLLPDANRPWGSVTYAATGAVPSAVTLTAKRAIVQGEDLSFSNDWISWTAPAETPLGYLIYRRTVDDQNPNIPFTLVTPSLAASALSYGDTIMVGRSAEYRVQAFNLAGGGDLSNAVRVTSIAAPVAETVPGDTAVGLRGFAGVVDVDMSRSSGGNTTPAGAIGEFTVTTRSSDRDVGFGGERFGMGFRVGDGQWLRWVEEDNLAACVDVLFCGVRRVAEAEVVESDEFRHFPAGGQRSQWLLIWKGDTAREGVKDGNRETFKIYVPPTVTGIHDYEYGFARLTTADELVWLSHGVATPGVLTHRRQYVRRPIAVTSFTSTIGTGRQVQLAWEMPVSNVAWIEVERQGGGNSNWLQVCCHFAPTLRSYTDEPPAVVGGAPDIWTYRITAFYHDGHSVRFDQRPQVDLAAGAQTTTMDDRPQFATSDQDMVVQLMAGVTVDHALPAATGGTAPLTYTLSDVSGLGLNLATVMEVPRLQTITVGEGMDAVEQTSVVGAMRATLTATDANSNAAEPLRLRIVIGDAPDAAPQGLRAVGGAQHIGLFWQPPAGTVAFSSYRIEQSPSGAAGSWTALLEDTLSNSTSHVHSGLSAGQTVHYRVAAINRSGPGPFSEPTSATTHPVVVPTPPTGLVAAASTGSVRLTWQAPSLNGGTPITGYRIEQQLDGTSSAWAVLVDDTGLSATAYTVYDVWPDLTVRYRVAAWNSVGVGPFSDSIHAIVPLAAPPAPARLVAVAGKGEVTLRWRAPVETIGSILLGYQIQSSADGTDGSWTDLVANTGSLDTEYVHTGLTDGQTVHYRVAAINTVETGEFAEPTSATTLMAGTPAAPPRVEAIGKHGAILVRWSVPGYDGGGAIADYNLQTSTTGEAASWPSSVSSNDNVGNVTSHEDMGVAAGTTKYYRVAAINANGGGAWSAVVSATSLGAQPQAPTLSGMTETLPMVVVRFTTPVRGPNAASASEYVLESSASGAPSSWSHFATFARRDLREGSGDADDTSARLFIGAGDPRRPLPQYFRLFAVNSVGRSPPSETFCRIDCEPPTAPGTPPAAMAPGAPVGLAAVGGRGRIVLRWQPPVSDGGSPVTGYKIEVSTDGQAFTDLQANTASRATQYVHSGLAAGVRRHYQVSAINMVNTGDATESTAAMTLPAGLPNPPRHLTVTWDTEMNHATLSWLAPASDGGGAITGYRIEISDTDAGPWEVLVAEDTASVATLMYIHTGATAHGINYYRVSAVVTGSTSAPSGVVRGVATATAPLNFEVRAGRNRHYLDWDMPVELGGGELLGWRLDTRASAEENWSVKQANTGTVEPGRDDWVGGGDETVTMYRLAAVTTLGVGAWAEQTATLNHDLPHVVRSKSIDVTLGESGATVQLEWGRPWWVGYLTRGYQVERRLGFDGEWEVLTENNGGGRDDRSYTDTLNFGDRATYRVFGRGPHAPHLGDVNLFPTVLIPPRQAPPAQVPTGLRVVSDFARSLITWQRVPESVNPEITGYRIEYAPLEDPQNYQLFGTVGSRHAESFARTAEDGMGGVGYYRIAHLMGSTIGEFSAPAASEMVGAEVVLDLNDVGGFTVEDATILYFAYGFPELTGEGFSGTGFNVMRRLLFGRLVSPADQGDVTYRGLLHDASELKRVYGDTTLDVNQDGDFDADDALILYYAYEMREQLGDGGDIEGDRAVRETFLTPLVDEVNPTDDDLRELLRRANALNPE